MATKMRKWFKQQRRTPTVQMIGKRIVPMASTPSAVDDDEDIGEPEWDDEATVTSGQDFLVAADGQVSLPTYSFKWKGDEYQQAWGFSPDPPPMMFLDVLLQICADFREARLLLFEIVRRGTSSLLFAAVAASRRGGLKLSGAALELDKALCDATGELKLYAEVGRGSYSAIEHRKKSQAFAGDQQIKDALATANRSLRRIEKTVRDGVVELLKMSMIHGEKEIDYDEIRKQTQLNKEEAQEACRKLHGVAQEVSTRMGYE